VFFKLFYGFDPEPTADHLCDNPLCNEPTHLENVGIPENNRRQAWREKMFLAAGWQRVDRMHQAERMAKPVRVSRWVGQIPLAA
jgi:hypothetical protein